MLVINVKENDSLEKALKKFKKKFEKTGVGQLQQARGKHGVGADELGDLAQIGLGSFQLHQQQCHHCGNAGQLERLV